MTILQILIAAVLIAGGIAAYFALRGKRGSGTARGGSIPTPPARNAVSPAPSKPAPSRAISGNFDISVDTVDGAQKVTVIVKGFSGSDWKSRVRPAIERVSSVKWEFPKNLGDGRRQLTGTVRGGSADRAVADIRSATARFGT